VSRALRAFAALALGLAAAGDARAHEVSGGLGTAASATDLYLVTCSDEGGGAPASLLVQVRDTSSAAAPLVSVQVQKGTLLRSSTDPVGADAVSSPAIAVNGGSGGYDVLVDKSAAGNESYTLTFHCQTGPDGTGTHTGTSHTVRQNQ
jgi:hypothetical protein